MTTTTRTRSAMAAETTLVAVAVVVPFPCFKACLAPFPRVVLAAALALVVMAPVLFRSAVGSLLAFATAAAFSFRNVFFFLLLLWHDHVPHQRWRAIPLHHEPIRKVTATTSAKPSCRLLLPRDSSSIV